MNQFSVDPANDYTKAIQGIGQILDRRRKEAAIEQQNKEAMAAYESGDPDKMAALAIQNPQLGRTVMAASGIKNEAANRDANEFSRSVISSPDNAVQLYQDRINKLLSEGKDPSNTILSLKHYQEDPKGESKALMMHFAATNPQGFKAYQDSIRQANPNLSDDQKGYAEAKRSGYTGGFIQYMHEVHPHNPTVSIDTGSNEETAEQKQVGKARGVAFDGYMSDAKNARQQLGILNSMQQLSGKALAGTGSGSATQALRLLNTLGIKTKGLSESEQYNALANNLVLNKSASMKGNLSDKDVRFLQSTIPTLGLSHKGRVALIKIMKKMSQLQLQTAREASLYRKKNGTFDQLGFEDYLKKKRGDKDQLSQFYSLSGGDLTPTTGNTELESAINEFKDGN